MKKLTYSSMATARLRANKKGYLSLAIGVFLAIFLVTTTVLSAQGVILAQMEKTDKRVGKLDAFLLDDPDTTDERLMASGFFSELGHVYVPAQIGDTSEFLGWYDETAQAHLYRTVLSGRMPGNPGEIAMEHGLLMILDNERDWQVGDTLELALLPIDGLEEIRTFTLVGILQDQTEYLTFPGEIGGGVSFVKKFPAALICAREPAFSSGRIAVHRTFLTGGGILGQTKLEQVYDPYGLNLSYAQFFGVSFGGHVDSFFRAYHIFWMDQTLLISLLLGILLAASLMLSCCVGISGAMEGILSRRSEEIGILRAVGATKRQIRRLFGRESLILALILSPVSILLSIGAVWLASCWMPGELILQCSPWLLLPIGLVSLAMILLSGYIPLRRSGNRMPMSVIRDTAALRKVRGLKSSKQFHVPNLISLRMLRLNPSRQLGAMALCALMLFSVACVVFAADIGVDIWTTDTPAFKIGVHNGSHTGYVSIIECPPLDDGSLARIRALPHVSRIEIERSFGVNILLPEESGYLAMDAAEPETDDYLGVEGSLYTAGIYTIVLSRETLAELQDLVSEGEIDVDAIHAGQEVLLCAPRVWEGVDKYGQSYSRTGEERMNDSEVLVGENDCFHAGQTLPIYQLYAMKSDYGTEDPYMRDGEPFRYAQREEATVTVGAVLRDNVGPYWWRATILTTEQGLRNMGLYGNGMDDYKIYLDGAVDAQTEEYLLRRLDAIAARSEGARVVNYLQNHREEVQTKGQILTVFGAITLVFLAVSVGMIVSSNTRRIQTDGRLIGMLRAVGAEERTILGIYTGQVTVSILGGFLLNVLFFALLFLLKVLYLEDVPLGWMVGAMVFLSFASWALSRFFLRLRIREVIRKSIIDNIREL